MNSTVCVIGVMVIVFVVAILPKSSRASLGNMFWNMVYLVVMVISVLVALSIMGVKPPF